VTKRIVLIEGFADFKRAVAALSEFWLRWNEHSKGESS
jgi:hypothetical protein